MPIGLGFDTGGTNTDAVMLNLNTGEVICKAKAPTTHENLSVGIWNSICKFDKMLLSKVSIVSLSSTLATNSVVEGKGCRVGLICIGEEYDHSVITDYETCIKGGHDIHGHEKQPLDISSAKIFLESVTNKIDGLAITSYMSVRNPDHENKIRSLANSILDIPIVCGHDLSSGLGFNERTSTCIMNAKLIPIMDELIRSVKKVMHNVGIKAPLMIMRGDGSMMGEQVAKEKPVETILSGPAASLVGAMSITGIKDAIVIDIGGTTTDIGIVRDGKPRLEPDGATICGNKTRVMAAKIATFGIGGDSRILVNGKDIILSTIRVIPLCVAASRWKCVKEHLKKLLLKKPNLVLGYFDEQNIILDSEMFIALKSSGSIPLTDNDKAFLDTIKHEPMSLVDIGASLGVHPLAFNTNKLESMGLVQRIGLTPTDILHANGTYCEFDQSASLSGVEYLQSIINVHAEEFINRTMNEIRNKLCTDLMTELIYEETGSVIIDKNTNDLLKKAITRANGMDYSCSVKLNKPIIGIGAPAGVYLKCVRDSFGANIIIRNDSDVGNAIGALTSLVSESIQYLIKPVLLGDESHGFEVFSKVGNYNYSSLDTALEDLIKQGSDIVIKSLEKNGVECVDVQPNISKKTFSYNGSSEQILIEMVLTVTATGKPKPFLS